MGHDLTEIANREYPGRIVGMGTNWEGDRYVGVYALTGRSAPSQQRRLQWHGSSDASQALYATGLGEQKDDPLLNYPALIISPRGFAVSNGDQARVVFGALEGIAQAEGSVDPTRVLRDAFATPRPLYYGPEAGVIDLNDAEPDKYRTPRIDAVGGPNQYALHRIWEDADVERRRQGFSYEPGVINAVSTYKGDRSDPRPFDETWPFQLSLDAGDAQEAAEAVYEALHEDLRVAAAVAMVDPSTLEGRIGFVNKHG